VARIECQVTVSDAQRDESNYDPSTRSLRSLAQGDFSYVNLLKVKTNYHEEGLLLPGRIRKILSLQILKHRDEVIHIVRGKIAGIVFANVPGGLILKWLH
jgi:hypothetical protein